jgi:hypothetical protein
MPFCALLIINILLIYHSKASRNRLSNTTVAVTTVNIQIVQKKNEIKSMGITIILLTFVFLLATLPRSIIVTFFLDTATQDRFAFYLTRLLDSFSTAYHSFNFLALLITNKKIASECKKIFYVKCSNGGGDGDGGGVDTRKSRAKSLAGASINTFQ